MRRGEVRLVHFDPVRGSAANKRRPAVVVSNDRDGTAALVSGRGVVTVAPLTTNTSRVWPFQVLSTAEDAGLPRDSEVQAEKVRDLAVERVGEVLCRPVAVEHLLAHHRALGGRAWCSHRGEEITTRSPRP